MHKLNKSKRLYLGIFTSLMIGSVGVWLLSNSHASTPTASIEAEAGTLSSGATTVTDAIASGGHAVLFNALGVQVPTSIASDCSQDVTAALLSWIASVPDNSTIQFGSNKCYRIDGTLELTGRNGLTFEGNGSKFDGHFVALNDQAAIWRVWNSTGITFNSMAIVGPYASGGTFTSAYQHAHAVDLRGTSASLSNLTLNNVSGDCVYFGLGSDNVTKSSGTFSSSSCVGTGRNGVSVTAGQNITVSHVTLDKIGFETFDVEPNIGSGWGASNIVFDSNIVKKYYLYGFSIVENAPIDTVTFSNNTFIGSGLRGAVGNPIAQNYRPQHLLYKNNTSDTPQNPAALNIDNANFVTVTGNTVPLTSGTFVSSSNSCSVTVSGNSFPGGTTEVSLTNPVTSC